MTGSTTPAPFTLRPDQVEGIEWLRGRPRALLGDEPGLGKSAQLLGAAVGRTLVVAPAMVLDGGTWDEEHARWRPDLDLTQVPYSGLNARVKTGANASATRPTDALRPEFTGHWDTVILDESHYIKNRKTSWTKAINQLDFDLCYLATGTPIPNWASELFVPLTLLHPTEARPGREYGSYWRWARQWFDVAEMWGGLNVGGLKACTPACAKLRWPEVCQHWKAFHSENLDGVFLQRLRDDVLPDLPPMTPIELELDMSPTQRRMYKELKKDYVTWADSGHEIMALNKAAQYTQLVRLSTGPELLDPNYTGKPSPKFDQMLARVADQARPSIVVGFFKDTVRWADRYIQDKLKMTTRAVDGDTSRLQRKAAIADFKAGRADVLCVSVETVAEGLTLTIADTIHVLERAFRPSRNEQVIRRIHRVGQDRPTTAVNYWSKGTVDINIRKLLKTKTDEQMRALRPNELAALL